MTKTRIDSGRENVGIDHATLKKPKKQAESLRLENKSKSSLLTIKVNVHHVLVRDFFHYLSNFTILTFAALLITIVLWRKLVALCASFWSFWAWTHFPVVVFLFFILFYFIGVKLKEETDYDNNNILFALIIVPYSLWRCLVCFWGNVWSGSMKLVIVASM